MKILLIKFRNIGDVLLSTALVENLKKHYPESKIDFALNDFCKDMVLNNPNINEVFIYSRTKFKSMNLFKRVISEYMFIKNITKNDYDIVINLTEGERGAFMALFSNAKIKLGYKLNKKLLGFINPYTKILSKNVNIHMVNNDLNFLNLLDKEVVSSKVSIFWDKEQEIKVDNFIIDNNIEKYVIVHPVSRWMFKCWEEEKVARIIDYIQREKGYKVILTASPDEIELQEIDKIVNLCEIKPYSLSGLLSLKELSYLISKSKLFFGIDSAPMHLAAAVDTPVIALFGASMPNLWGPWDNEVGQNYKFIDGIQKIGKHTIIGSTNMKIILENNRKVSLGMKSINYEDVKVLMNKNL